MAHRNVLPRWQRPTHENDFAEAVSELGERDEPGTECWLEDCAALVERATRPSLLGGNGIELFVHWLDEVAAAKR